MLRCGSLSFPRNWMMPYIYSLTIFKLVSIIRKNKKERAS